MYKNYMSRLWKKNIKNDQEMYSCELKNKYKTLYEETKNQRNEEMYKVKNVVSTLNYLNKSNEKKSCD
jgi:hypothetical protein